MWAYFKLSPGSDLPPGPTTSKLSRQPWRNSAGCASEEILYGDSVVEGGIGFARRKVEGGIGFARRKA